MENRTQPPGLKAFVAGPERSAAYRQAQSEQCRALLQILWADPKYRAAQSERASKRAVRMWRSRPSRYEFIDQQGRVHRMKSSWEVAVGKYFDQCGLVWEYEAHTLLLSTGRRYTPDFWLPEWNCYVEIKGFRDSGSAQQAVADGHAVMIVKGERALAQFLSTERSA